MLGDCKCGHGYHPLWGASGPPARIPPRSPHQPAHSFHFDAFALCLDSARRDALVRPLALIRVAGHPESRDNNPVIVSLLTGGGGRHVDRNGGPRHTHQTTHRWWGGVLVSVDLGRCVCGGGACVVESAGDGGIVHTSFFTTLLPTVASCGYNVAGLFLVLENCGKCIAAARVASMFVVG